jgi:signal transduction histidine kinase
MGRLGREIADMAGRIGRLQDRLVDRERTGAALEMIDHLQHSIREPLAQIRQLAVSPSDRTGEQPDVTRCREQIAGTVAQFERWLGELRSGLVCNIGVMRLVDIPAVLRDVQATVQPVLDRHRVHLAVAVSPPLEHAELDQLQFEQALVSLITNAVQASQAGQTVWVDAVPSPAARDSWEVRVRDEGSGIAPEMMERIFLPFFTTKKDGNGIGLGLAKTIIHQHGGELLVHSAPGEGSCFTIRLPLHHATGAC